MRGRCGGCGTRRRADSAAPLADRPLEPHQDVAQRALVHRGQGMEALLQAAGRPRQQVGVAGGDHDAIAPVGRRDVADPGEMGMRRVEELAQSREGIEGQGLPDGARERPQHRPIVARVAWREKGAEAWGESPIMSYKGGAITELWAGRIIPSIHNKSAPDMVFSHFSDKPAQ